MLFNYSTQVLNMSKRMKAEIIRKPGSVFVGVQVPEKFQQAIAAAAQPRVWAKVASEIASDPPIETPTAEPATVADAHEIRIYAVDVLSGKRKRLFTGKDTDDTADLCQAYANLTEYRVEWHDAASATVYHPETSYPIPTLADWVEVVNSDTGQLIWVGLREDGFDARCRKYADTKGVGLRVDSAHLNHSQFYTPKNEVLRYARQNAEHFAEKYGLAIADAVGVLAITGISWLTLIVMGVSA